VLDFTDQWTDELSLNGVYALTCPIGKLMITPFP
jgi:hypothetical protein